MTDKQTLLEYRLKQAEETLADAEKMLHKEVSSRTIINRSYYAMFYAVLALFVYEGINPKTSKHSGVIGIFDKEIVHMGKLDKKFSKSLHRMFDARQEADYKEMAEPTKEEASESAVIAKDFLNGIKSRIT